MPRRKKLSDAEVLSAALPVILLRGADRVTLPQLGEAVGLSPATLVQRFGSKLALVEAAFDLVADELEADLARPRAPTDDPRKDLVEWLVELANPLGDRARLTGSFQILERDMTVPERNERARAYQRSVRERIARFLENDGVANPHEVAWMVEAHWHGLVVQWGLSGDEALGPWLRSGLERLLDQIGPHQEIG